MRRTCIHRFPASLAVVRAAVQSNKTDNAAGRGRWRRRLAVLVLVVLAVGAGWWAGQVTLTDSTAEQDSPAAPVIATVVEATVGQTLSLSVTLTQPVASIAANLLPGVVTTVSEAATFGSGDTVYAVDGTPVRVVSGVRPFYRDLAREASGPDVLSLNTVLVGLDYLTGPPTAEFTFVSEGAVEDWQRDLGIPVTGRVLRGELIAVPALPAALRLGEAIRRGALVSGGEDAVLGATGEQRFALVVSPDQARLIPSDATVRVRYQGFSWGAVIASTTVNTENNTEMTLAAPDGGLVCGADCVSLPGDEQLTLPGEVIVVPEVTGPAVPAAAVRTGTDGATYVRRQDGTEVSVSVIASGQGLVIVDGLEEGQPVLVSGEPDAAPDGGP